MHSDLALLEAWRAGDRAAGDALFSSYFAAVRRFFLNKVDRSALDDLIQRTFMACVEGRDRVREDGSFRAYLFGAAHNILRGHYRESRRARGVVDVDEASVTELGAGPLTILGRRQEQRLLLEALRQISLADQVLLELFYWEQLTGPQLGEFLGVPENTARSRLRRARLRLNEALARVAASDEELTSTRNGLERWAAGLREQLRGG
ncbi:MAG: sigma-70 family RNA polymerase sigma factor [Nannocystaceae bacterium]|nr:sigma-70 family RNA polymerase sigma factor [Myxococcales bacterium]